MATASRLLAPAPPPAAPSCRLLSNRVAVPRLRCRASASASASPAGGAALLERDGTAVAVREFVTLDELRAAVRLRVRTFYEYAFDSIGAEVNEDSQTRAYLSNVCVAKELQKKGLGYALVDKSKKLAREWGEFITFSA
nr:unnamed protein product [Digitaria exilis]